MQTQTQVQVQDKDKANSERQIAKGKQTNMFTLERKTVLPTTVDKAWAFFSDPRNLTFITPSEMEFQITSNMKPGEFYPGMLIEYVVRPFAAIPFRWVSEIREVEEQKHFQDVQLVGPYKYWMHRHEFRPVAGGVEMRDMVEYQVPYGWLGRVMHSLFIRRKLEYIFDFRAKKIHFLFSHRR